MPARIYQPARSAMTSGTGKTKVWVLDFGTGGERTIDPLMGWTGSSDTTSQLRLTFDTKEAAMDYARKRGLAYTVQEPQKRRHRPRGYGDNFATNRRLPWSH